MDDVIHMLLCLLFYNKSKASSSNLRDVIQLTNERMNRNDKL